MQLITVGTRSSPMALAQAEQVARVLALLDPAVEIRLVPMTTSGDRWTGDLAVIGGKGAFVRELDRAQLAGEVTIAVHCLKDVPGDVALPEGVTIAAYLPREDVHDAVVSRYGGTLDELPADATVATSSPRRRAQLTARWPHLRVTAVRGNTNTRLRKLDQGEYDAMILAVAGLRRIGQTARITQVLPVEDMLPAVGAGTIVVTTRTSDTTTTRLVAQLNDPATALAATAERAMLRALTGHCHSPIGGLAHVESNAVRLHGAVYSPDGAKQVTATMRGPHSDADDLGRRVADALLRAGARDLIASAAS
ncbi:hydroxymethylbilane synthase [Micromonospora sp. NBC_01813]|uniref:hydroxymethylbilane synthase n=1 Tax=Micromonospora sp. NBC_01813 TaxID=2975988 RepID=UPI002DDA92E3|nr:hydroxymethylbilane synthase [Micromonospora sp. NBC_01813]WSA12761.1 hydroxymethylbilane synthase [Micromonospora sp. NBC_01813]